MVCEVRENQQGDIEVANAKATCASIAPRHDVKGQDSLACQSNSRPVWWNNKCESPFARAGPRATLSLRVLPVLVYMTGITSVLNILYNDVVSCFTEPVAAPGKLPTSV